MSTEESQIMARLRAAGRRSSAAAVSESLAALTTRVTASLPHEDVLTAFLSNVLGNGGSIDAVADRAAAMAAISRFIAARQGHRRLVAGHDPRLAALPWRNGGLLPRFGAASDGDRIGVSYAKCAIAETGSVVLCTGRDNPALNSLLPEVHIVLVDRADIHRYLEALWRQPALTQRSTQPRGVMMISGPSSTADIALQMVTGAHGPRAWHVVVLDVEASETVLETARAIADRGRE